MTDTVFTTKFILLLSALGCWFLVIPTAIRAMRSNVRHHDMAMALCILLMASFYSVCAALELFTEREYISLDFLWINFDALNTVVYLFVVKSIIHKRNNRHAATGRPDG